MTHDYTPVQPINFCHSYKDFPVPSGHPLSGIVLCFYEVDTREFKDHSTFFFPDACVDVMYFTSHGHTRGYAQGSFPTITEYSLDPDAVLFGIRFASGQFARLCDIPASEYLSGQLGLQNICLFHEEITEKLNSRHSFMDKVNFISDGLLFNLTQRNLVPPCVSDITDKVFASRGSIRCSDLARELGYTERQLRNLTGRYIGLSPKQLCNIVQFQYAVNYYTTHEHLTNEQVSYEFNYHDTSHMNKTFHRLTGLSPREFFHRYLATDAQAD